MQKMRAIPEWQHSINRLSGTILGVVGILALYWAQSVFIPLALAVFLSFILNPLVRYVQKTGLPRVPAVVIVVCVSAALLLGVGWLVMRQTTGLIQELPDYTENIRSKIRSVKEMSTRSKRFDHFLQVLSGEIMPAESPAPVAKDGGAAAENSDKDVPTPVVVRPEGPAWLNQVPAYLAGVAQSFGVLALALILVIFMLINREDLRNRFLRLVSQGRLSSTTKAVDEAGQRVSRYLFMQAVLNGGYGVVLSLGLFLIGVKYAILWGLLAGILRYVPYVGPWLAAIFPIALSVAMQEGWWAPLAVVGLILVLELLCNNVMEPWLYGQSMGVSAVAQVISAAFWAFLWGPIGLVLSAPMTVVLLVIGKHVPRFEVLDVLLGDEPVLEPDVTFYQRLLARDQDEAAQNALRMAKTSSKREVFDQLLIPAINYAKRDQEREELTEGDEQFLVTALRDIIEDVSETPDPTLAVKVKGIKEKEAQPLDDLQEDPQEPIFLLGCPSRDEFDELSLEMLQATLDPLKWKIELTKVETLTAEVVTEIEQRRPSLVCIGALPPGGLSHTRLLCKRIREHCPEIKIIICRWGIDGDVDSHRQQFLEAGADIMTTSLADTEDHLISWLPVLRKRQPEPAICS